MNPYVFIFLISFVPFFESRYAIVYAYYAGIPFTKAYTVLLLTITIQSVVLPIVLPYLDYVVTKLSELGIPLFDKLRNFLLNRARKKGEKIKNSTKTYLELFSFVAIPLPGTGIYTGALIYYVLGLDKKKTIITLFLGGTVAMTINTLITYGLLESVFKIL